MKEICYKTTTNLRNINWMCIWTASNTGLTLFMILSLFITCCDQHLYIHLQFSLINMLKNTQHLAIHLAIDFCTNIVRESNDAPFVSSSPAISKLQCFAFSLQTEKIELVNNLKIVWKYAEIFHIYW